MKDSRKKSRSKAASAFPPRARAFPRPPLVPPSRLPSFTRRLPRPCPRPRLATGRVVLGTSCTIQEAAAVRAHLLAQAALPGPYEIDGGSVELVDTAGVQLIVAFALDCLEKGVAYKWTGRSATLEKAIELLGVSPLLEYPA